MNSRSNRDDVKPGLRDLFRWRKNRRINFPFLLRLMRRPCLIRNVTYYSVPIPAMFLFIYVDTLQCLYFCLQDVFVVLPVIVVVKKYIDIGNMMTGSLVILFKLLFYVTVLSFLWWKEEICFWKKERYIYVIQDNWHGICIQYINNIFAGIFIFGIGKYYELIIKKGKCQHVHSLHLLQTHKHSQTTSHNSWGIVYWRIFILHNGSPQFAHYNRLLHRTREVRYNRHSQYPGSCMHFKFSR